MVKNKLMNSSNGNNLIERRFANLVESQRDANKRHQLLDEFVALGKALALSVNFWDHHRARFLEKILFLLVFKLLI